MEIQQHDRELLNAKGITEERLREELDMLRDGFPYLSIECPATVGAGITRPTADIEERSVDIWDKYAASGASIVKMVPASGAASRMFKDLFAFLNGKKDKPDSDFVRTFFDRIEDFAFFTRLNFVCLQLYGMSVDSLVKTGRYRDVVAALLHKEGLNYGQLPKALLQFHKITGTSRTPLEEHLAEGAAYARDADGRVHVHYTVSDEHIPLVQAKVEEARGVLEHAYGVEYTVGMSVQKPSTDTVAATLKGEPYREKGELFFRPGGHGALIENLNEIDADVVFIKNIDNVVPDTRREVTLHYKKVLGGILVATKATIDRYCRELLAGTPSDDMLSEMLHFLRNVLCVTHDNADSLGAADKAAYVFSKLNRPLRVCGMVRNEGEPGGGPFLCYSADGTVQPQILESSQLDPKVSKKLLKEATHFNPVDLVCALKNYDGEPYDLTRYVDKNTGFISRKSREGVEILALELPGLWNGAMSDWNTIFVEVPLETFNPVKTVNDLLRSAHMPFPE